MPTESPNPNETTPPLPRMLQDRRLHLVLSPRPEYELLPAERLIERLATVDAQLDQLTSLLDRTIGSEDPYARGFLRGLINALVLVRDGHF